VSERICGAQDDKLLKRAQGHNFFSKSAHDPQGLKPKSIVALNAALKALLHPVSEVLLHLYRKLVRPGCVLYGEGPELRGCVRTPLSVCAAFGKTQGPST
jgi:hypothetical protein